MNEAIREHEPTVDISVVSPQEVFDWASNLVKYLEKAGDYKGAYKLRWEIGAIITSRSPGAEEATEGLFIKEGEQKVGAAVLAPEHLLGVFVLPEFQHKGYGSQLFVMSIRRLLAQGAEKILVEVADNRSFGLIEKLPDDLKEKLEVKDVREEAA